MGRKKTLHVSHGLETASLLFPLSGRLTGNLTPTFQLLALAKAYKISYQLNPRSSSTQTLIDHSGDMMVKDAQGKLRLLIKNHASVEDMEHDIKLLLKEKSRS
ncbi:MAG: hypothetical protein V3T69_09965 [Acidiferrobacterales bacterium]|jgi:cytochrome oxidase Cu insertion factor (SCO1/SenC/PrrC family)